MDNAHHIDSYRAVETELLGNSRHLISGKHNAESEEHIAGESKQSEEQQGGLHKRCKADCRYLFHPLVEAVRISSRNGEHIQGSDRHLHEEDSSALDVLEEYLYHAVGKGDQRKDVKQAERELTRYGEAAHKDTCALSRKVNGLPSGEQRRQVVGEGVLKGYAELIQFYGYYSD